MDIMKEKEIQARVKADSLKNAGNVEIMPP